LRVVFLGHEAGKLEPGRHLPVELVLAYVEVDRPRLANIHATLGLLFIVGIYRKEHVPKVGDGFVQENRRRRVGSRLVPPDKKDVDHLAAGSHHGVAGPVVKGTYGI